MEDFGVYKKLSFGKTLGLFEKSKSMQEIEGEFKIKRKPCLYDYHSLASNLGFSWIGDGVLDGKGNSKALFCQCLNCGYKLNIDVAYLIKGSSRCPYCFLKRIRKEALDRDLISLGRAESGDNQKFNYLFNCGHTQDLRYTDVRLNSFRCQKCYDLNQEKQLKDCNLTLISKEKKGRGDYVHTLMYNDCKHLTTAFIGHLNTGTIGPCKICYEENLKESCDNFNIDIISKLSETKRLIRFKDCDHEKAVRLSNLKRNIFRCDVCLLEKQKQEAEQVGLKLLGKIKKDKYTYKSPCGHVITKSPAGVRAGHWTCRECDAGYLDFENNLYLFKITAPSFSFLKLGYSKAPEQRKNDYKMSDETFSELLIKVKVPTGRVAIKEEGILHKKYKDFNYSKEVIKPYLIESGFSECYPLDLELKFLEELNLIKEKYQGETFD